jgi:hypothetical protein
VAAHLLARDPFHLTLDQIGRLTPWQVRHVYLRDDLDNSTGLPAAWQGSATSSPARAKSPKEIFWMVWRDWRGLSEEAVQAKWAERQQAAPPPARPHGVGDGLRRGGT